MGMGLKNYLKRGIQFIVRGVPEYKITVDVKTTQPSQLLNGRNIIITGGGRGLGFYIAKKSIAEGANVLITGRTEDTLKKGVSELGEHSQYMVFDARNVSDIPGFLKDAEKRFNGQKIDSLVSNAGISLHEGGFHNVTEEGWDLQMDTNLKGNFFMVKCFIEYLENHEDKKGANCNSNLQ